jgi:hypothetical protein
MCDVIKMDENIKINKKLIVPAVFMTVELPKKAKPEKRFVCGYEWKPFEKMSVGYLFAIPHIEIDVAKNECSEGQACLNVSCQFNKTTFNSYCDTHEEPAEYRPYFLKKWPKLIQYRQDLCLAAQKCKETYTRDPANRIIQIKKGEIT